VDRVLHLLSQHQLFLKQSKCSFGALEVEYLGHIVSKDGVRVDPKKIEAMQDWPCPKTLKRLCGFVGLTSYYHKFIVRIMEKLQHLSLLSLKIMLSLGLHQLINPSMP
jgi:hypothetical protein